MSPKKEKVRLGGMALQNGILVHSFEHWAAAVRGEDGTVKLASGQKPDLPALLTGTPLLRGVARMAEVAYLLPLIRRRLPEARLPMESPGMGAALVGSALLAQVIRRTRLHPAAVEVVTAGAALFPAMLALRGSRIAGYHGAEHKAIGGYEHDGAPVDIAKEHERCGSHMVGPLIAATTVGNLFVSRLPASRRGPARLAVGVAAMGAATEAFAWMTRHRDHPLAKAMQMPRLRAPAGRRHPRAQRRRARGRADRARRGAAARGHRDAPPRRRLSRVPAPRDACTLEAVDWIPFRTMHVWLHAAVAGLHTFLVNWGIFIFLGLLCWLTWKFISMMPNVKPKQLSARSDSTVRWEDVAGVEEVRAELEEVVDFLKDPTRFAKLGAKVPKGVLLYGPPGTGKTLLAKAVAHESDANFYFQSASSFVEMWSGLGAARIRKLFQTARKNQPAIIFIDELDAVGRHRGGGGPGGGSQEHDQTLNQLLVEMDGFDESDRLVIIAASNQLAALDSALLRPGRFDRHIGVAAPDLQGREQIMAVHTRDKPLDDGVRLAEIARQTSGLTGADLANICNEAAISAGRAGRDRLVQADFTYALERVVAGLQQRKLITDKEKRVIAYHEAGHALVARLMGDAMQLHKVTIVPRGQALGYTMNLPEEDRYLQSTDELSDWLKVILAGRAAEQVVFGRITNGAANDLERATAIARAMVFEWGMGESMPHQQMRADNYALSEDTKRMRDAEQRGITDAAYRDALRLVEQHRPFLDRLAQALLATETLERAELDVLLEGLAPESNSSLDIGVEAVLAVRPPAPPA